MKAIALISGGLDSILAAKVIQQQGVGVIPLCFRMPFAHSEESLRSTSLFVQSHLDAALRIVDISQEFLEVVRNPRHGYGSNMNPCIDCKIFMVARARQMLAQLEASFIVSGEVLGQRPMSQHRKALNIIEESSGARGLLLRPLSARLLPATIPQAQGWVRAEGLFAFNGRSRKPQIALAASLGIKDYKNPAGGCLLADLEFSHRLKDLIAHDELRLDNVQLLKLGRHFRLAPRAKLIVGRNENENKILEQSAGAGDYLFSPPGDNIGATALGRGEFTPELIELAGRITCRFFDAPKTGEVLLEYGKFATGQKFTVTVNAIDAEKMARLRIANA